MLEEFHDSCHGTVLAIVKFHVALMPHIKFQLSRAYDSRGDLICEKPMTDG